MREIRKVPLKSHDPPDSQAGSPVVVTFLCCSYDKDPPTFVYFFLIICWLPDVPYKSFTSRREEEQIAVFITGEKWKGKMRRGKMQV